MEIILLQDIEKVGNKHEVVTVKDGYGRNYLIPQKMAIIANAANMKKLDAIKEKEAAAAAKILAEFQTVADKLKGQTLKIGAKAGSSGKIFGSVTNLQIAQAIKDQLGVEVDRRIIELPEDVKDLGTYSAAVNLHKEVQATVAFEVVAE